jgi:hypothetical protein
MPRACTICTHRDRQPIDHALAISTPNRRIATQYAVTESALRRHKSDHLPMAMVKAVEAAEVVHGGSLLDHTRSLHTKALRILATAERANNLGIALAAIREARGVMELLAKMEFAAAQAQQHRFTGAGLTLDPEKLKTLSDDELDILERVCRNLEEMATPRTQTLSAEQRRKRIAELIHIVGDGQAPAIAESHVHGASERQ